MTHSDGAIQNEVIVELKEILAEEFPLLITTYLQDANDRLFKLQSAIDTSDAPCIKAEAHSLKGSSINLGAVELAELLSKMETCGSTATLAEVPALLTAVQSEFSRAEHCLRSYL